MSCCQGSRRFCCHGCGWAPEKYDYPVSDVRYSGYHAYRQAQAAAAMARNAVYARPRYHYDEVDRLAAFYGRRDPLFGRTNAGGFDQPDQANWDGDQ